MSRRAAIVEDEFDDDTDLPLPNHPIPSTANGPLIQEIDTDDSRHHAGPASPPQSPFRSPPPSQQQQQQPFRPTVTDLTPYKNWTCIYSICIDAKRPYGTGQRRVAREAAVWWPLSKDIADAAIALGLRTLHEVDKAHPRDWENPGRVRVQWKRDGRLANPALKTKKLLLEAIAARIQAAKPGSKPVPPFRSTNTPAASPVPPTPTPGKGKQAFTPSPKKQPASASQAKNKPQTRAAPAPPHPLPPLASRVSPYSPALASGMLVDAVKAGMAAQAQDAAAAGVGGAPGTPGAQGQQGAAGGMQKGKRKVVRVRG